MERVFPNKNLDVKDTQAQALYQSRLEMRRAGGVGGSGSLSSGSGSSEFPKILSNPKADRKRRKNSSRMVHDPSSSIPSSSSSSSAGSGGELEVRRITETQIDPNPDVAAPTTFGYISVSGRSREMEDAISIRPDFCRPAISGRKPMHFFAVFDGHGGSHVARLCRERMHVFLQEELMRESRSEAGDIEVRWRLAIERSFERMDEVALQTCVCGCIGSSCDCDSAGLSSEIVGSTAVISLVTPDQVVVANCGDSRAVVSRGGRAVPLSSDHKPDRPDELERIEAAGGRVIYLNGARVLGILATSRALGDKYLKPVVISKPEITFTNRTSEDECLILASDGLWDVLSNDVACDVARRCLFEGNSEGMDAPSQTSDDEQVAQSQARCSVAAALLTRLALGRRSADNISVIVIDLKRC